MEKSPIYREPFWQILQPGNITENYFTKSHNLRLQKIRGKKSLWKILHTSEKNCCPQPLRFVVRKNTEPLMSWTAGVGSLGLTG